MNLWLQSIFLIASGKKGISANQLHRTLGVTLKTAWFLGHRIREAIKDGDILVPPTTPTDKKRVGSRKGAPKFDKNASKSENYQRA